jgi:hypothetical protein
MDDISDVVDPQPSEAAQDTLDRDEDGLEELEELLPAPGNNDLDSVRKKDRAWLTLKDAGGKPKHCLFINSEGSAAVQSGPKDGHDACHLCLAEVELKKMRDHVARHLAVNRIGVKENLKHPVSFHSFPFLSFIHKDPPAHR